MSKETQSREQTTKKIEFYLSRLAVLNKME